MIPAKSLGFFPLKSGKSTLDTGCFKAGFPRNFPLVDFLVFPCLTGRSLGKCEAVVETSREVGKVGQSDALGRERRPYRRGAGS